MEWRSGRALRILGALSLGLGFFATRVEAQVGGTSATDGAVPRPSNSFVNPIANPYLNPYLNPYMTQTQMAPGTAALYFMAAQQANGGIGSGRLGGPKSVAMARAAGSSEKEDPRTGTANVPGAGASKFFNRNYPTSLSKIPQYHRPARQFPSIRTRR